MFTGLVEQVGRVRSVTREGRSLRLTIEAPPLLEGAKLGDSIAINGVCLTVVHLDRGAFTTEVMPETFTLTNLSELRRGSPVNLERTLAVGDRLGGHIVQGHVDGVGLICSIQPDEIAVRMRIAAPRDLLRYMVPKGSVAVDGVSLTITTVAADSFGISLIPHTAKATVLGSRRVGEKVNLEVDILAKYVEGLLAGRDHDHRSPLLSLERW